MAQVVLSAVGTAIGGPVLGAIGALAGAYIDRSAVSALSPRRQVGPRLEGLQLQGTSEGAPVACAFGHVRLAGEVIWAARFKESRVKSTTGGGKGGGQKTVSYSYSLSFAVGLCEGPIDGIGRIWANGSAFDASSVSLRVYLGGEDQTPDTLIESIEGSAPAYRGLAYVVFEDLPLDPYGDRIPQFAFEVFRRPRGEDGDTALEERLSSICLIPGAGEFVLASEPVLRRDGLIRFAAENVNNAAGQPDFTAALDQLAALAPNLDMVTLVVGWFGDDLRCGVCQVRPGVESLDKETSPINWTVNGLPRFDAHLISANGGGPAYGGTPSDQTVIAAIAAIRARGWKIGLYPFLFMDVPSGNDLADPYGAAAQGAYPWRGRITCHPAAGRTGSPDKTATAGDQVEAFFGACDASDFTPAGETVSYAGPDEWSFRRFILHYANLADLAGGVDLFVAGSELRGLTTVRSGAASYPAASALADLVADCKSILPHVQVGYAANWSEYFGHHPGDGSGDVFFHLDPVWSAGDFVGIDYYPPLADWRDGAAHLDAQAGFTGPHEAAYIDSNIEGGEDYDWYYASDADRAAQTRTPILDGAYGEDWLFRLKDLRGWWIHAHHDRPGGVRSSDPTVWTPQSKPIRLIEFGCPAVDKGANSPNLFIDPKSSESHLPPFSSGARDDLGQRACLEAVLGHFADPAHNPTSEIYDGPMVAQVQAWCWDARPYPDFPARSGVWADAPNWTLGHWLSGRLGISPLAALVRAIGARAGLSLNTEDLDGALTGYLIDQPMSVADALTPLAQAFAFDAAERDGGISMVGRQGAVALDLSGDSLALPDESAASRSDTRTLTTPPDLVQLRFIDAGGDYRTGAISVRRNPATSGGEAGFDLPMVISAAQASAIGQAWLDRQTAALDQATISLAPLAALRLEPADRLTLHGGTQVWRVQSVNLDETPSAVLVPLEPAAPAVAADPGWTVSPAAPALPAPVVALLDLPPLPGFEDDIRPLAAVAADPWAPRDLAAGANLDALISRGTALSPATVGVTLSDLPRGPLHRIDRSTRLVVQMEGVNLQSRSLSAVLAGANALAVRNGEDWEILQFLTATPTGADSWTLTGLLRGQLGSEAAMGDLLAAGAELVLLDDSLTRLSLSLAERGLPYVWRAYLVGGPAGGAGMTQLNFTWRAVSLRPFSPCHLAARVDADGDLILSWIRRARVGGDAWDGEVPLSETSETYRVEILNGELVKRTLVVSAPEAAYAAADQASDFPAGTPNPIRIRVSQGSEIFGWGSPVQRDLGYRL